MTESNFGDFEFERKFYVRKLPEVTALDPRPELIVQAYLFVADGYAVRVRLQSSAPAELDGSGGRLIEAIGVPFSTSTVDSEPLSARSIREDLLIQSCSSQLSVPNSCVFSWHADMRRRVAKAVVVTSPYS